MSFGAQQGITLCTGSSGVRGMPLLTITVPKESLRVI